MLLKQSGVETYASIVASDSESGSLLGVVRASRALLEARGARRREMMNGERDSFMLT